MAKTLLAFFLRAEAKYCTGAHLCPRTSIISVPNTKELTVWRTVKQSLSKIYTADIGNT